MNRVELIIAPRNEFEIILKFLVCFFIFFFTVMCWSSLEIIILRNEYKLY